MNPPSSSDLDDLVADFVSAVERGQAPEPADWLARHPGHAAELAAFLADLGRFGDFLGLPPPAHPDLTARYGEPEDPAAPPSGDRVERFDEYELLGVIGRGGMGTVYRARLAGTTLVVALKQIREGGPGGEGCPGRPPRPPAARPAPRPQAE